MRRRLFTAVFALALTPPALPQANAVPGRDAVLEAVCDVWSVGHIGTWPTGTTGIGMSTTVCNVGTDPIPWEPAMSEDHPVLAFLIAAERDGRLEQISRGRHVKHVVSATNQPCGTCNVTPGLYLSPGCSDTYDFGLNSSQYWLGPPEEIDTWLGTWTAQCSYFDRGDPAVSPPADCDGVRDLTTAQVGAFWPLKNRTRVKDADLVDPAASLIYQAMFVVPGEDESLRADNLGWRRFQVDLGHVSWFQTTTPLVHGSALAAWTGATRSSATNPGVDGRVYAAVRATASGCSTHYEYALHNRDNSGGFDSFRVPLTPGATVTGAGMKDVDADPLNDWTASVVGSELVFAGPGNPLEWNSIYNFWFDTDASPATGAVTLTQASGTPNVAIAGLEVPGGALVPPGTTYCTAGTSALGCRALLSSSGVASATAPSGFQVSATGVEGGKPGLFFYGSGSAIAVPWGNGTSFKCVPLPVRRGGLLVSTGGGGSCDGTFLDDLNARWTAKPSHNPGAGATTRVQLWYRDALNTSNQKTSLSDALEATVCP